jgi:predicted transcriptional regulator
MPKKLVVKLDKDVVSGLGKLDDEDRADLSALANEALRELIDSRLRRRALLAWIYELEEEHGPSTPEEAAKAQAFWDEVCALDPSDASQS